ncbi:MAG TPA: pseudouridine synthase [Bacteroidota bacterium]|nr:pseudouridine synthase [Bacteroidota bacterium]
MRTSRAPHRVSLPRALSKLGLTSRSQAFRDISDGKVKVNGNLEVNPHRWVNLQQDKIEVDGRMAKRVEDRYVLFHKPKGVTTTRSDERGGHTIYSFLGADVDGLMPVGRLDKETTGLLLLTNDHKLADFLTSPRSGIPKTYIATVNFPISRNHLAQLGIGVEIVTDGKPWTARAIKTRLLKPTDVEISIAEGKNRQVRKMFEAVGYVVLDLKRVSLGPLSLGNMKEGQMKELTREEISELKNMMQRKRPTPNLRHQSHLRHQAHKPRRKQSHRA